MFTVAATPEQISYAEDLVARHNFGRRGKFDGTSQQQRTGLLGQTVVADLLGAPRPRGDEAPRMGRDFVLFRRRFDVRTMGRHCTPQLHWPNNFVGLQKAKMADVLIFCSLNLDNDQLTVCGWIEGEGFLASAVRMAEGEARTRADGTTFACEAELFELASAYLHQVTSPANLTRSLEVYFAPAQPGLDFG
jgi:hypothetical protein